MTASLPGKRIRRKASNSALTSPSAVAIRLRDAKALTLRMEGKTFEAIGEELGFATKGGAYVSVKRSLDAITREPAEMLIKLDLERIDVLWEIQYLRAQSGDVQAMAACMKLMERRAKLLGLDAPVRQEVTGKDGADLVVNSGVLMVPAPMLATDWERMVVEQQQALLAPPMATIAPESQ